MQNPYFVSHCINNNFIIANPEGCFVLKQSNKILEPLYKNTKPKMHFINVHPQGERVAIADKKTLAIYDILTKNKIWQQQISPENFNFYCSPCFNSQKSTILVANNFHQGLDSFDYDNPNVLPTLYSTPEIKKAKKIYFHPTEQECIIARDDGFNLTILANSTKPQTYRDYEYTVIDSPYNHDGSLIAIDYKIQDLGLFSQKDHSIQYPCKSNARSLKFHPTHFIIAALVVGNPNSIGFWKSKILTKIASLTLNGSVDTTYENNQFKQLLDFSSSGKNVIVALTDKCLVIPLPFSLDLLETEKK